MLQGQLQEKEKDRSAKKDRQLEEDKDYVAKTNEVRMKDMKMREQIEAEKRQIFKEEIENQKRDKEKFNEIEGNIKKAEDNNYKKKLEHDR